MFCVNWWCMDVDIWQSSRLLAGFWSCIRRVKTEITASILPSLHYHNLCAWDVVRNCKRPIERYLISYPTKLLSRVLLAFLSVQFLDYLYCAWFYVQNALIFTVLPGLFLFGQPSFFTNMYVTWNLRYCKRWTQIDALMKVVHYLDKFIPGSAIIKL